MLKLTGEIDLAKAEQICHALCELLHQSGNLSAELIFEDEDGIKKLNKQYRNIDEITDVLSFPSLDLSAGEIISAENYPLDIDKEDGSVFIGSIVICLKRAQSQAAQFGHSQEREIYYLICHALLHLFGFDHIEQEDKIIMRQYEEAAMEKAGLKR